MPNLKEDLNIKEMYGKQCVLSKDNFIAQNNFSINGLSSQEAQNLLHKNGVNQISQTKPKKWYNFFL